MDVVKKNRSTKEWTVARIDAVWLDLEALRDERPVQFFRRRFRKEIDAAALPRLAATGLFDLFVLWAFLQVLETWCLSPVERREGLHRARDIAVAAQKLAPDPATRALATFDCGLISLLIAVVPDRDLSLAAQLAQSAGPLPHHLARDGDVTSPLLMALACFDESRGKGDGL